MKKMSCFSFDLVNNKLIFLLIGAKRSSNYVRPTSYSVYSVFLFWILLKCLFKFTFDKRNSYNCC